MHRMMLVGAMLVATACGGAASSFKPTAVQADEVRVTREAGDAFATPASSGSHSAYAVSATSFVPVDGAVVEHMLRQRMGQASALALRDLLADARAKTASRVLQDLITAVEGLVVQIGDADTRSQVLLAALVRAGSAQVLTSFVVDHKLDLLGCPADQTVNAVYEALAQSTFLRPLGFTAATGVMPKSCAALTARLALTVDTLAVIGPDLSILAAPMKAATEAAKACGDDTVRPLLPIDVRLAFQRVTADAATFEIASLRDLRTAFARSRQSLAAANPPALATYEACFGALDSYTRAVETRLDPVFGDWSAIVTLPLTDLQKNIATVQGWLGAQAGSTELARVRTLLVTVVQGRPLRRADLLPLTNALGEAAYSAWGERLAGQLTRAVLEVTPQAIREDATVATGVRLDVPSLASTLTTRYAEQQRAGLYIRATIGAGYAVVRDLMGKRDAVSSLHEELGFGYRWGGPRVLAGPHIMASGLVYRATAPDALEDAVVLGAGISANVYRLVDVSINAGRVFRDGDNSWIGLVSLQLPLPDYLSALMSGGTSETTEKK